jgi:small subunit ribosomal protein S20
MPIIKGAKKALRASKRKKVYNDTRRATLKDVTKKLKRLVTQGKAKEAQALLPQAYKALDKAAKTGVIKKNTASRKKSRLAKLIKKVTK